MRTPSIILLPTLECNVACDYCFEHKAKIRLTDEQVPVLAERLRDHLASQGTDQAHLYWQGGEVLMLGPDWFFRARDVLAATGCTFHHHLQTNLIGWNARWEPLVREMFGGSLGTSMDYPNAHRRLKNGSTERYTEVWLRAVEQARAAGLGIGVIAVLHEASLQAGPEAFYRFFTETAGITDFQVNMPFPGGPNEGRGTLCTEPLTAFLLGLLQVWRERGLDAGVKLGPFAELVEHFSGRPAQLPCIWQPNCANEFLAVDARGQTALCDCWVTSYPQHSFGNAFAAGSLSEMLGASPARERFLERPQRLVEAEDCRTCPWLSMCHGGCPVRTFTALGTILAKDPYCQVYQALFAETRRVAAEAVRQRLGAGVPRRSG